MRWLLTWAGLLLVLLVPVPMALALRSLDPAAGVVEVLQLPVSVVQHDCWRQAEALVWEPWLEQQQGYRGRDLLWDPRQEQAVVLVGWDSQAAWDAIPAAAIEQTQSAFDGSLQRCLGISSPSPLPLERSGVVRPVLPPVGPVTGPVTGAITR
ncbi:MAG: TIGR03792 family protein [Cyanobacteriota bacterium]|nr:TIGR03792 family protein [Cyanobacteriota bacterium]